MKSIFRLLIAICTFALKANAQIYFNNTYNLNQYQGSTSIIEDTGYLAIGQEITSSYRSMFFIKVNLNGDTLWTKSYPRNQFAYYTGSSNSLIKTRDNNYAFGGTIINLLDTANTGDCLLVKLNTNGDTLWTKKYGGAGFDNSNIVIESSDRGFVLVGATNSYGNGQNDFYFIKTDSAGNFLFQQTYGSSLQEVAYSALITMDNGYILSGSRNNELYIVKTDSNGIFQWQKIFAGTAGQGFLKQLPDSTYILVGAKAVTGLAYQAYMAKLTKAGIVIWQQTYGGVGDQQFYAVPIILNDGSIVCSGVNNESGVTMGMLIKTDSLGNQQWLRSYYSNLNIDNYVNDVKHTLNNGFIMSGQAYSTLTDFWLVKVDSNGCEVAGCNVGVEENSIEENEVSIYPNPTNAIFTISAVATKIKEVRVIDVMGRIVNSEQLIVNSTSAAIDMSGYAKGVYFVQITDGSAGSATGVVNRKIVLQ